jgi:hypothetical protein
LFVGVIVSNATSFSPVGLTYNENEPIPLV